MGCGLSLNDNEVKSPNETSQGIVKPKTSSQENIFKKANNENKNFDLKQIKTQKSIIPPDSKNSKAINSGSKEQQPQQKKQVNARIYLFGQSKDQRKIIQFQALPTPHIQILLSRTHNLPPVKYQPPQIILQQSQELTSSNLYISTSHPPYNYMFATFIKYNTIFLCGGVNFNFDNVSSQAFLYSVKDQTNFINSPQKNQKNGVTNAIKNKRRIGNNLMGSKFQRLPLMKVKRYSHMGVYFKAGKLGYVYIFGGRTQNDETLTKCEKYSIQENKWSEIAPMSAPRSTGFSIIVNKKIYVFGGYTKEGKRSKKIERYNPTFDSWDVLNIKLHRGIETGIILPCQATNQILIVGGNVQFGALKSVIKINFQNQTYIWDSDLKKQRLLQKGIALLDQNTAYVLGGDFQDTVEKYSYKDKTWKIVNNLNYGECVSPDQINAFTLAQQTIQLNFDTDTNNHATNKSTKQNESSLSGELKYIFGSDDYPCIYEISTVKWVLKKKNVPMSLRLRSHMTISKIKEGKIFIAGGIDSYYQKPSKAAYIYYPGTNKAIQIAKIKDKKYGFAACSLNNFVYIFGGQDGKQGKILNCAQKYNINDDKWSDLPEMPRERTFSKAILSPSNKILLIGGTDSLYQTVSQIDIFDPELDSFSTYEINFPLASQIKYINFTDKVIANKMKRANSGFEFLDDLSSKKNSEIMLGSEIKQQQFALKINSSIKEEKIEENNSKVENISNVKVQDIQEHCMVAFAYNSYKKQDQAYLMSISMNPPHHITFNEKSHKLYPYSLTFTTNLQLESSQKKEQRQKQEQNKKAQDEPCYYFISNKGVFKWQQSTKKMQTQIVINQMHMLQMPLQKFCII